MPAFMFGRTSCALASPQFRERLGETAASLCTAACGKRVEDVRSGAAIGKRDGAYDAD